MKILISGGSGNLAKAIVRHNTSHIISAPNKSEMDITNPVDLNNMFDSFKPDIFIHAAALTRPMSQHQYKQKQSIQTNIIGTSNAAIACLSRDIKMVYLSTDYVYPGTDGNYKETDPVSPFNDALDGISKYAWSKLGGECAVRLLERYLIIRACICEYPFPHKEAFDDVVKSYIYIPEAARFILKFIELDLKGIINLGGKSRSVYDLCIRGQSKYQ